MSSGIFPQTGDSLCDVLPPSRRVTVRSTSSVSLKERGTCRALFFFSNNERKNWKRNTLAEGNVKNNEMRFYFFTLSLEKPTRQSAAQTKVQVSLVSFVSDCSIENNDTQKENRLANLVTHTHKNPVFIDCQTSSFRASRKNLHLLRTDGS